MEIDLEPLDVRHVKPLRAIHAEPEVLRWWGSMEPDFPFDEPDAQRFAIVIDDDTVAGLVQFGEEDWPWSRHAWIDIFVSERFSGRGVGTAAVRRIVRLLIEERGHHHVSIDPLADNAAAIRCYEKAGFEPVGIRRRFWRDQNSDELRDEMLMQLVV